MTPLDLMAAVLPSPGNGYYCAVELTKKKQHVYGQTLEELMPTVEKWAKAGYDTYFALGTFGTDRDRTKENMHGSQVLAVDLDCNHPKDIPNEEGVIKPKAYPSAKAAAQALQKFCEDTGLAGLGDPWLVHSGGGIHAYWPLDEMLFKEDWYPLAKRFKEMCIKHGLAIDTGIENIFLPLIFDESNAGPGAMNAGMAAALSSFACSAAKSMACVLLDAAPATPARAATPPPAHSLMQPISPRSRCSACSPCARRNPSTGTQPP